MKRDRNFEHFTSNIKWFTYVNGVGFVPTKEAPESAVEAMKKYNSYQHGTDPNSEYYKQK